MNALTTLKIFDMEMSAPKDWRYQFSPGLTFRNGSLDICEPSTNRKAMVTVTWNAQDTLFGQEALEDLPMAIQTYRTRAMKRLQGHLRSMDIYESIKTMQDGFPVYEDHFTAKYKRSFFRKSVSIQRFQRIHYSPTSKRVICTFGGCILEEKPEWQEPILNVMNSYRDVF